MKPLRSNVVPLRSINLPAIDTAELVSTIQAAAKKGGWTNQDLAKAAKISPGTLSKWFSRESRPNTFTLAKVARVLKLRLCLNRSN